MVESKGQTPTNRQSPPRSTQNSLRFPGSIQPRRFKPNNLVVSEATQTPTLALARMQCTVRLSPLTVPTLSHTRVPVATHRSIHPPTQSPARRRVHYRTQPTRASGRAPGTIRCHAALWVHKLICQAVGGNSPLAGWLVGWTRYLG